MQLGIIGEYIQYGIFAGLFLALFIYNLRNSEKRETALRHTLDNFADKVGDKLNSMCHDVEEVKADVEEIRRKIK